MVALTGLVGGAFPSALSAQTPVGGEVPRQGEKPAVTGERYMVSSSHPVVNEAMVEVLENGGNAVNAMITAVLLQPVVKPHMSTIAGGTGGLIYMAATDELIYLDAELNLSRSGGAPGITSGGRIRVPGEGERHGRQPDAGRAGRIRGALGRAGPVPVPGPPHRERPAGLQRRDHDRDDPEHPGSL